MARIRSIEKINTSGRLHRSDVDCTYQNVFGKDGTKYVQLTTYGPDQRKSAPKSSQTIHLDKEMALKLAQILNDEFGH